MILQHFQRYKTVYLFMAILLLTGVIFGAVVVNSMSFIQKQDLYFHLERYFNQLIEGDLISNKDVFKKSVFQHFKLLFLLFILGLSVIGLPLIWIIVFLKGLVIGFSVGFIVSQLGLKGLVLATISIAPQNMVIIPVYILASSFSMAFSLALFHQLFSRSVKGQFFKAFVQYSVVFITLFLCATFGSLLETFISNKAFTFLLRQSFLSIINVT